MSYGVSLTHSGRNTTLIEDIDQAISIILFTVPGERIYDPEYGCKLRQLLDAPQWFAQQVMVSVVEAIEKYERRVDVLTVDVDKAAADELTQGLIRVRLTYKLSVSGLIVSRLYQSDGTILALAA